MTTQTEALDMITKLQLAHQAMEAACIRIDQLKAENKTLKEALAQPEQEPVAWRYKPARENNPRWEYTTEHPLDMGDGYLRPSLVEYCKCIEPLFAKEKPKLMLEKFREMEDLLEEPAQQEPVAWTEQQFYADGTPNPCVSLKWADRNAEDDFPIGTKFYTTPPKRTWVGLTDDEREQVYKIWRFHPSNETNLHLCKTIEAKLKEKNT